MAAMAPTHGASARVRLLCEKITLSQRDEINMMRQWLQFRKQAVPDSADHIDDGDDDDAGNAERGAAAAARCSAGHGVRPALPHRHDPAPSRAPSGWWPISSPRRRPGRNRKSSASSPMWMPTSAPRSPSCSRCSITFKGVPLHEVVVASPDFCCLVSTILGAAARRGAADDRQHHRSARRPQGGQVRRRDRVEGDDADRYASARRHLHGADQRRLAAVSSPTSTPTSCFAATSCIRGISAVSRSGTSAIRPTRSASPRRFCTTDQGDPSIWGNLLFISDENGRGRIDCGSQGISDTVSKDRAKGVRIFDVSDPAHPRQVTVVQTCRGTHTHTLVPDPKDKNIVYIWGQGSSNVRSQSELAGCAGLPVRRRFDGTVPPDRGGQGSARSSGELVAGESAAHLRGPRTASAGPRQRAG